MHVVSCVYSMHAKGKVHWKGYHIKAFGFAPLLHQRKVSTEGMIFIEPISLGEKTAFYIVYVILHFPKLSRIAFRCPRISVGDGVGGRVRYRDLGTSQDCRWQS